MAIIPINELQARFNSGGFLERAETGELTLAIVEDNHPSAPVANEPYCTRSQTVEYVNRKGRTVAIAHRYLRKDGTIGASGREDPKMVLDRGIEYYTGDV